MSAIFGNSFIAGAAVVACITSVINSYFSASNHFDSEFVAIKVLSKVIFIVLGAIAGWYFRAMTLEREANENGGEKWLSRSGDKCATSEIKGVTYSKITDAIERFPLEYPNYKKKPPQLDTDVRPWLKADNFASDREAHVIGRILEEHFDLKGR